MGGEVYQGRVSFVSFFENTAPDRGASFDIPKVTVGAEMFS